MDDIRTRLARCFALVFPKVDPGHVPRATIENTEGWDSLAFVTLLTVAGEEFAIDVNLEEFEGAASFEAIAARIAEVQARG